MWGLLGVVLLLEVVVPVAEKTRVPTFIDLVVAVHVGTAGTASGKAIATFLHNLGILVLEGRHG